MRVWPGLKLVGASGKVAKGTFVTVAEVGPERVVLDRAGLLARRAPAAEALPRHHLRPTPRARGSGSWTAERSISTCGTSTGTSRATSSGLLAVL